MRKVYKRFEKVKWESLETGKFRDRDQIFLWPVPRLFSVPIFFRDRFRDFFRYQIFSGPVPRLFSVPNFFRDRFRDFFRYQIFPIPVPIPSNKMTNSREREFPGPGRHTLPASQHVLRWFWRSCRSFQFLVRISTTSQSVMIRFSGISSTCCQLVLERGSEKTVIHIAKQRGTVVCFRHSFWSAHCEYG